MLRQGLRIVLGTLALGVTYQEKLLEDSALTMQLTAPPGDPTLKIECSSQFVPWLQSYGLSLAFTTYQAGKLFFVGVNANEQLSIFERTFDRCMGLAVAGKRLYMSTRYQLWRFEDVLTSGQLHEGYDALYLPRISYVTGDLDIHDIVVLPDSNQRQESVAFVNTLFNCVGTVSGTHSFVPLWKPPFISEISAGDRCHLNGLALRDGKLGYATATSQSGVVDGWRNQRRGGGCVIDIARNQVIAQGLSMPHSPRWYRGKLWLLNSGTGEFGYVEMDAGKFVPVAFCPGYLRGCALVGNFAIVGLSRPRHNKTFSGLELDDRLSAHNDRVCCGLQVIDLERGEVVHSLQLEGVVEELYDVCAIKERTRPMAVGFRSEEVDRIITVG